MRGHVRTVTDQAGARVDESRPFERYAELLARLYRLGWSRHLVRLWFLCLNAECTAPAAPRGAGCALAAPAELPDWLLPRRACVVVAGLEFTVRGRGGFCMPYVRAVVT